MLTERLTLNIFRHNEDYEQYEDEESILKILITPSLLICTEHIMTSASLSAGNM